MDLVFTVIAAIFMTVIAWIVYSILAAIIMIICGYTIGHIDGKSEEIFKNLSAKFFKNDDDKMAGYLILFGWSLSLYLVYVMFAHDLPIHFKKKREKKACELINF